MFCRFSVDIWMSFSIMGKELRSFKLPCIWIIIIISQQCITLLRISWPHSSILHRTASHPRPCQLSENWFSKHSSYQIFTVTLKASLRDCCSLLLVAFCRRRMEDEALLMLIINPGQTLTSNEVPCECGGQPVSAERCGRLLGCYWT